MSKILTPLELKVMNLLWKHKKAFVKDLLADWPKGEKPAYNTVSTTVRILEDKKYVNHEAFGRTHQYFPLISKLEYQKRHISNVLENVFAGSAKTLISALVDDSKLSNKEIGEIEDLLKDQDKS